MNQKKVAGIGIYEKGKYSSKLEGSFTREYRVWEKMLQRCKPDGWQQRNKPAYVGCEVHPDFIKFQWFAEWCNNQIGFGESGFEFDKDILLPGNKVYGPDTCCFVPGQINKLLIKNYRNRGDCPIGVSYDKVRQNYRSEVSDCSKTIQLGRFKTSCEAFDAYRSAKMQIVHRVAETWKGKIDHRVYEAMMQYDPVIEKSL